ncbi:MAG: hypothetical protein RQ826_09510 [Xanthomonadales bacterium]|nr:hypothetical protein [Xanthomonadales bacterium]
MKVNQMIESKYLRKEDIDADTTVTLGEVTRESMPNGDQRFVLHFPEYEKGLVMNTTTIRVLADAFGGDTDHWKGQKAVLYVDPNVSFKGQVVGGLRLRPIKGQPVVDDDLNDAINF